CSKPTVEDKKKLIRILQYLAGTRQHCLVYKSNSPFEPRVYADASHLLHEEGHGQQGMFITNGSAPVAARSTKIKMMTRSSAESELVALEDASTYIEWYTRLLADMGMKARLPIPIYQDNKSAIIIAITGATFRRTKHLMGKQTFVRERIADGKIVLRYKPTKDMLADILTKPVNRDTLERLLPQLSITS
ncbi:MAG: Ty1/Copia family ribonuclease HI, partial [Micrococcales bacterium]|nr:Ty1/Copia family ribonuclease HI [Micrococcales bacterium]